jgi:hypothetical protein
VTFFDDFSGETTYLSSGAQEGFGFGEYADGVFRIGAEPMEDFRNYKSGGTIEQCEGTDCEFPDVIHDELTTASVDVDVTQVSGSEMGSFGIACSYAGTGVTGSFVGLTISADARHYAIALTFAPGGGQPVDNLLGGADRGSASPAIEQGVGSINHLHAECGSETFSLSVNDELVATGQRSEGPEFTSTLRSRGIALIAAPGPDGPVEVEFDDLVVSELPEEPAPLTSQQGEIFADPLTSPSAYWATGDIGGGDTVDFVGGAYRFAFPEAGRSRVSWPRTMNMTDSSTQVDVELAAGHELSYFGVACRATSSGAYEFVIGMDGSYAIFGKAGALVDFTSAPGIEQGSGAVNTVRLDCVGDTLTAYVNGTRVDEVQDSTLERGWSGLSAGSPQAAGGTMVDFTDFVVSWPEP